MDTSRMACPGPCRTVSCCIFSFFSFGFSSSCLFLKPTFIKLRIGIFVSSFFHLFAHDKEGFLGKFLRDSFQSVGSGALLMGLDDRKFAVLFVSVFMFVTGILMLPEFLGPSFSVFEMIGKSFSFGGAAPAKKTKSVPKKKKTN